jgi:hypothetical protein
MGAVGGSVLVAVRLLVFLSATLKSLASIGARSATAMAEAIHYDLLVRARPLCRARRTPCSRTER